MIVLDLGHQLLLRTLIAIVFGHSQASDPLQSASLLAGYERLSFSATKGAK